jgi:hypothetical protein
MVNGTGRFLKNMYLSGPTDILSRTYVFLRETGIPMPKPATPSRLNAAAAQIGTALGHFAARIDALQQQREQLATELKRYISGAEAMLKSVRGGASSTGGRRAAIVVTGARRGRPAGFKMSEEAKQKMRDAWKRRRKQMKLATKGVGKKGTRSKKEQTKPLTERAG